MPLPRVSQRNKEEIKTADKVITKDNVMVTEAERELNREDMTGQDALFALIAIRMMKLS